MKLFKTLRFIKALYHGMISYADGRFDDALRFFDRAISLRCNSLQARFQRGMTLFRLGDIPKAITEFEYLVKLPIRKRMMRDCCYNLGKAHDELRHLKKSLRWYDRCLQLDPGFANAYCNRGSVHVRRGDEDSDLAEIRLGLADLDKALSLNPTDAFAYYNRATANKALQNFDAISGDLEKFLELAPANHPYRQVVPELLDSIAKPVPKKLEMMRMKEQEYLLQQIKEANDNGKYEEALPLCDKFLKKDQQVPMIWDEKAHALFVLKRHSEALACLEDGLAVNPAAARLWQTKGNLLAHLKRYREAIGAFEKYVALAPPEAQLWVLVTRVSIEQIRLLVPDDMAQSKTESERLWPYQEARATFQAYIKTCPTKDAQLVASAKRAVERLDHSLQDELHRQQSLEKRRHHSAPMSFIDTPGETHDLEHYDDERRKVGGDPHKVRLVAASPGEMNSVTLVYHWYDTISYSEADKLDSRLRAYIACVIGSAAKTGGLRCEPGPPHGRRPSWLITEPQSEQRIIFGLQQAGFEAGERACQLRIGPVFDLPGLYASDLIAVRLAEGFQQLYAEMTV